MSDDLLTLLDRRIKEIEQAERVRDVLNRPDEDFIAWRRRDGSIGSMMRPAALYPWAWRIIGRLAALVTVKI